MEKRTQERCTKNKREKSAFTVGVAPCHATRQGGELLLGLRQGSEWRRGTGGGVGGGVEDLPTYHD